MGLLELDNVEMHGKLVKRHSVLFDEGSMVVVKLTSLGVCRNKVM